MSRTSKDPHMKVSKRAILVCTLCVTCTCCVCVKCVQIPIRSWKVVWRVVNHFVKVCWSGSKWQHIYDHHMSMSVFREMRLESSMQPSDERRASTVWFKNMHESASNSDRSQIYQTSCGTKVSRCVSKCVSDSVKCRVGTEWVGSWHLIFKCARKESTCPIFLICVRLYAQLYFQIMIRITGVRPNMPLKTPTQTRNHMHFRWALT